MKTFITVLFLVLISAGCMEFNQNEVVYNHELVGAWSNVQWSESGKSMSKVQNIEKNTYGYFFNSNGTMVARTNSGWCGTPPIVTADYEGTWKVEDDKIILSFAYWGGVTIQSWQITGRNGNQVTVQIINAEYHPKN